jgi:hypothetical protein
MPMRRILVDLPGWEPTWYVVESTKRVFHVGRQEETTIIQAREPNDPEDGMFGNRVRLDLDSPEVLEVEY